MNNMSDMPAVPPEPADPAGPGQPGEQGHRGRLIRWGAGVTLAGLLAGGGIAWAVTGSGGTSAAAQSAASASASNAQLNALLSASGTAGTVGHPLLHLRHLRGLGGMYGSFTYATKSGDETLAFERGTIESVSGSNIVVRAADGTTTAWQLVSDTVVRDHGKSDTAELASGQLVFVGGPVVSGARDARLIVIRTPGSGQAGGSGKTGGSGKQTTSLS
jgi:hypothetical protein